MKRRIRPAAGLGSHFDGRLAAYLAAAGAAGAAANSKSHADVVFDPTVQPFGINEEVSLDFNNDGQIDFQIDHDRVDLGAGNIVDYLQLDKNDVNGASAGEDPLPIDSGATFALSGTVANDTAESSYVIPTATQSDYPAALVKGTVIGPASTLDFQEGTNFLGAGTTIRANRLIDEDAGQVDMDLGGLTASQIQVPTNGPNFLGLGGEVRYLGVKMDLNTTGEVNYGWIGIQITNEEDATGNVVGWGYQTTPGAPIAAGVPEPSTLLCAVMGGLALVGSFLWNRRWRR